MESITIVTGLWNLNCDKLYIDYDLYKKKLIELLKCENNMCIYIDPSDEEFVRKYRDINNTKIIFKKIEEFKTWFEFYPLVEKIRTDPKWYNQTESLSQSPEAKLEMYNPIMMSKMFMLHDVKIMNPFNSKYFFWIDASITNEIKVLNNLP